MGSDGALIEAAVRTAEAMAAQGTCGTEVNAQITNFTGMRLTLWGEYIDEGCGVGCAAVEPQAASTFRIYSASCEKPEVKGALVYINEYDPREKLFLAFKVKEGKSNRFQVRYLWENTGTAKELLKSEDLEDAGSPIVHNTGNYLVVGAMTCEQCAGLGVQIAHPKSAKHVLLQGEKLKPGECITSPNSDYQFVFQDDANAVLYRKGHGPTWASGTNGRPNPAQLVMQEDGNLVAYNDYGQPFWASNTYSQGTGPYCLEMQNDGNLVLYDACNTPLWHTDTWLR